MTVGVILQRDRFKAGARHDAHAPPVPGQGTEGLGSRSRVGLRLRAIRQDGQHHAACAGGIGEEHLLLALLRHVHIGGKIIFAGLDGRDAGGKVHVAQLQLIARGAAEAHHQVDVVAHVFAVLDIGPGHIRRGGDHADGAVLAGEAAHIHHLAVFIHAKPDVVQLLHGAVRMALGQESVELFTELGAFRVVLAEGEAVFLVGDPLVDIVDPRLLRMDGFEPGLIAQIGVDPARHQGGDAVGIAVEQHVFAVREISMGDVLHQRAHQHAQALAVVGSPGGSGFGWGGGGLRRSLAPHHDADNILVKNVREGQGFLALGGQVQVGHHAVHVAGEGGGDDGAVIIDLEFHVRAQPGGEAVGQFDVVAVQLAILVVAVRGHDAAGAHGQAQAGAAGQGDLGHGFIFVRHPALVHVVQGAVRPQFPDEAVDLALQIGDLGHGGQTHGDLDGLSQRLIQQANVGQTAFDGQLHLVAVIRKGVDLALGHGGIAHELVGKIGHGGLGQQLPHGELRRAALVHAHGDARGVEVRRGGDFGLSRPRAQQQRDQQNEQFFHSDAILYLAGEIVQVIIT